MGKRNQKIIGGAVFASALGFIAGLLTAPKSGKETRADIAKATKQTLTSAEKELQHLHAQLMTQHEVAGLRAKELRGAAKKEADAIAVVAGKAKDKVSEVIETVQKGTISDEDLQAAAKEAKDAIEHIRRYLQK